jgi:hypothetical protein
MTRTLGTVSRIHIRAPWKAPQRNLSPHRNCKLPRKPELSSLCLRANQLSFARAKLQATPPQSGLKSMVKESPLDRLPGESSELGRCQGVVNLHCSASHSREEILVYSIVVAHDVARSVTYRARDKDRRGLVVDSAAESRIMSMRDSRELGSLGAEGIGLITINCMACRGGSEYEISPVKRTEVSSSTSTTGFRAASRLTTGNVMPTRLKQMYIHDSRLIYSKSMHMPQSWLYTVQLAAQ